MERIIPTDRLTPADVPGPDASWSELCKFAHTIDGYAAAGEDDDHPGACARIANARRPKTLEELRVTLFYQFRADHFGFRDFAGPDGDYVRSLVAEIRAAVSGA